MKGLLPSATCPPWGQASLPHFRAPPTWPYPSSSFPSIQCQFSSLQPGQPPHPKPYTHSRLLLQAQLPPTATSPSPTEGRASGQASAASRRGLPLPGVGSLGKMTSRSPVSRLLGFAPGRPGGQAPTDSAVYEPHATGRAPQIGHSTIHSPHGGTAASPVPARGGRGVQTRKGTGDATSLPTSAPASSWQRPRHHKRVRHGTAKSRRGRGGMRVSR